MSHPSREIINLPFEGSEAAAERLQSSVRQISEDGLHCDQLNVSKTISHSKSSQCLDPPLALQEAFCQLWGRLRASGVKTVHVLWNRCSRRQFYQTAACWSGSCSECFWHQRKDHPGIKVKTLRSVGAKRRLICYKKSPFPWLLWLLCTN